MQRSLCPIVASALLCVGCLPPPRVEAQKVNGAWVFSYADSPTSSDLALHGGQAAVVDGCLEVDDTVVIWHRHHLDTVEEIIGRIDKGETVDLSVGGGGRSLDEGDTMGDFPDIVREHCSPSAIWYTSNHEIQFGNDG